MMPPKKTTTKKTTAAAAPVIPVTPATPAPVAEPMTASPAVVERSEVKGSGKTKAAAPAAAAPRSFSYDDVAKRAFEIYASRGYAQGDPSADWYEAERQLRAGL